jgi:RNA polymerase sigma-70 factor (ECF subfamily)
MEYSLNETSRNIESAIDQLPPACRQAFLLSRYEEKSYKEIAEILHISVNTVEKHIGKALKKLREVLK